MRQKLEAIEEHILALYQEKIIQMMKKAGKKLILLDEIDKVGNDYRVIPHQLY